MGGHHKYECGKQIVELLQTSLRNSGNPLKYMKQEQSLVNGLEASFDCSIKHGVFETLKALNARWFSEKSTGFYCCRLGGKW